MCRKRLPGQRLFASMATWNSGWRVGGGPDNPAPMDHFFQVQTKLASGRQASGTRSQSFSWNCYGSLSSHLYLFSIRSRISSDLPFKMKLHTLDQRTYPAFSSLHCYATPQHAGTLLGFSAAELRLTHPCESTSGRRCRISLNEDVLFCMSWTSSGPEEHLVSEC